MTLRCSRQAMDLKLQFALAPNGKTYIRNQYCHYPFHVCRAQYVDTNPFGLATVYLQSCAGGIFEGDRLFCEFHSLSESQAHITTQASTIVHSMEYGSAEQYVLIEAEENSFIEYLPDPLILFPHSNLRSKVVVSMHPTATVYLADALLIHDPKNRGNTFGEYHNETKIMDLQGKLLCLDRYHITGDQNSNSYMGVMGNYAVLGTIVFLSPTDLTHTFCDMLKDLLDANSTAVYAGVSVLPNKCGVWVRLMANEAFEMRSIMTNLWGLGRVNFTGTLPHTRKK